MILRSILSGALLSAMPLFSLAQIDSVAIATLSGDAPIITTNTTGSVATTLQLTSNVYPSSQDQTISWSILSGTISNASINTTGLLSVPAQTTGYLTVLGTSGIDATKFDTMQVLVYCKPPHTNPINWFVIDNITIAGTTLNNTSTTLGNAGAYTLFSSTGSTTATLVAGTTYSINATVTSTAATYPPDPTMHTYSLSAWIDYNKNGVLESTEWFYIEDSASNSNVANTFTIPATVEPGYVMMRIRSRLQGSNNGAIDACSNYFGSGQTEDYVVYLDPSPLAIQLTDIKGKSSGEFNLIEWSIASYDKGDFFELERSFDGSNFSVINKQMPQNGKNHYSYTEPSQENETSYYRLNMRSGIQNSYSKTISISARKNTPPLFLQLFPNPASNFLTIHSNIAEGEELSITITDINGSVVKKTTAVSSQKTIDVSQFSNGIYLVKYKSERSSGTIKFIKQ